MEVTEQLQLALLEPGQDQAWLEVNWLHGACISASQRAGLIDWLVEVSNYLNLSDITLHLAVCLFDRTLANAELDEKQLQLTAITCLHLASKVEEDFVPAPSLLLPLLGGSQQERTEELMKAKMVEMARTERMILKALNFHLRASTAATFLHYFTQLLPQEARRVGRLAKAILDLSLLSPWYGQVRPSHLAAAVLTLANCLLQVPLALPLNLAASLLQVPTLLSKDLHLCKVLPSCTTLLFRLITLLEAKEDMPGVLRKHNKVLGRLSPLSVARLGRELEGKQDIAIYRREG